MRSLSTAARVAAPFLVALTLAACQEPTGVGLGLIDDDTSTPAARELPATSATLRSAATTTGGFAAGGTPAQSRVLVGSVVDAVYGDATAVGYLDASSPTAGRPTNFQDSTITAVALQLRFDDYDPVGPDTLAFYVYGDPTAPLPVEVREVTASWAPTDLAVDTTLPTGDVIATATISPADTTVTIDLAPSWVAANLDKIRSSDFVTAFEGFEVRVPDGTVAGAVRGFDATQSAVLVATPGDTLRFPVNEVLTSLAQGAPAATAGVLPLRAGRPEAVAFAFDFPSVGAVALARAELRLPLFRDGTGEAGFIRPLAREAILFGVAADSSRSQPVFLRVPPSGDALTTDVSLLTPFVQDVLIGTQQFDRYEVTLATNPVSLDVFPVYATPPAGQRAPRFVLTVVGQPVQPS